MKTLFSGSALQLCSLASRITVKHQFLMGIAFEFDQVLVIGYDL